MAPPSQVVPVGVQPLVIVVSSIHYPWHKLLTDARWIIISAKSLRINATSLQRAVSVVVTRIKSLQSPRPDESFVYLSSVCPDLARHRQRLVASSYVQAGQDSRERRIVLWNRPGLSARPFVMVAGTDHARTWTPAAKKSEKKIKFPTLAPWHHDAAGSTRAPATRGCGSWQSPLSSLCSSAFTPLPSRTGPKHAPPDVQASPRRPHPPLRRARSRMDVPAVRVRYGVRRGRRGVLLPPRGASLLAYSRSFYLHARLSMGLYVGRLIDPRAAARAVHAAAPVRGDVGQPNLSLVLERGAFTYP